MPSVIQRVLSLLVQTSHYTGPVFEPGRYDAGVGVSTLAMHFTVHTQHFIECILDLNSD